MDGISRKFDNFIKVIAAGVRTSSVQGPLDELTQRQKDLEAKLAGAPEQPWVPRLHPRLCALCQQRVDQLPKRLEGEANREVLEAARALIDQAKIHPPVALAAERLASN
ncbi:hypothetical protein [Roseococcus pinisoli]|uniref:Uncharacterized protein n=1 Tax=Roseococcus pinisoli TaxID=2835040 RepID=A0ABS5QJD3_9PROT|nr:hypothetical protein [Roseococcus pinisoli]MBS7813794.1 hypothetical protein [Roseococcus pinisoli]